MGYESELYLGETFPHGVGDVDGASYVSVIAMFDLCKMGSGGPFAEMRRRHPAPAEPAFFFYGTDGDTRITGDPYGDNLQPLPLDEVVDALKAEIALGDSCGDVYRRLMPAYALFAAMLHNRAQWSDVVVLHYGH